MQSIYVCLAVMDHKYKALLQNIPTRHVITAIAVEADRAKQIENLRNLDINNFFVLGTFTSIKAVLGKYETNADTHRNIALKTPRTCEQTRRNANISSATSPGMSSPRTTEIRSIVLVKMLR